MRRPFIRLLGALLLSLSASALAHPALWVARQGSSTVYLFGTVHLLPHDTDWRFPALQKALDQSQALYIEITDDSQAHMTALVLRYGLDPAHPLSSLLTQQEQVRLAAAAKTAGVPGGSATLNVMHPWLAALTLSVAPLLKAGLDPRQGVDKQLKAQMSADGKPVHGLENAAEQIRFFADMSPSLQLSFLRQTLDDTENAATELKTLIDAWKRGDTDAIARLESTELRQHDPRLYRILIVRRDQAWAVKIASMLKQPGTIFVAVGAAHLAGPDSVQAALAARGIRVQRLP
ncbi:TraB/GumN family protein [Dyella sp. A6]|uniref:TraB/GumN family protein n=1 Tax=Dyella aluminiiresistens TaxID=3069105 RepID=UPI002E766158|nr:TraB/GumN family protein [Dyella sp. A6]